MACWHKANRCPEASLQEEVSITCAHKNDWARTHRRSCHPQCRKFQTCMSLRRPSKCSELMLCMISFRCPRTRKGEEPPSNMHDTRAAAAPLALKLTWTTLFSCHFLGGKHINLLELESLISLLKRKTRERIQARRLLVLMDSRKRTIELTEGSCFENWDLGVSLVTSHWSWCGCPLGRTRRMPFRGASRSIVGMPHCESILLHRQQSLRPPMLSRSSICSGNHCRARMLPSMI